VSGWKTHLSDEEVDALRGLVGHRVVVSISSGRIYSDGSYPTGIFFDDALIEYWPTSGRRRHPSNWAIPMSGDIEERGGAHWISFKVSPPTEVFGVQELLSNGQPWWFVPPGFDYWPPSQTAVTQVDLFEGPLEVEGDSPLVGDVRLEIHFADHDVLGLEAGVPGRGFVMMSAGTRRPWGTRDTLRLRQRLN
jgi:hypothetical protein